MRETSAENGSRDECLARLDHVTAKGIACGATPSIMLGDQDEDYESHYGGSESLAVSIFLTPSYKYSTVLFAYNYLFII